MDVWMIWIRASDGTIWLETAWDSDSMSENSAGWQDAKAVAYSEHAPEDVLIVTTSVDFDKIQELFTTANSVTNDGIRGEDS